MPVKKPLPLPYVVLLILSLALACATVQRAGEVGEKTLLSCGEQYAPAIASTAAGFGVRALLEGFDEKALETAALGAGLQVGGCAVFEFRRAWKAQQPVQLAVRGVEAVPDPLTKIDAVLARLSAHWGVEFVD